MNKTYVNKITMPVLLAIFLAGGVGNVWSIKKKEPEKESARKEAAEAEKKKIQEKIARTAKKQADTEKAQKEAEDEQKKALESIKEESQKKAITDTSVEELEKRLQEKTLEATQKEAITKTIALKKATAANTAAVKRTEILKTRMTEATAKFKSLESLAKAAEATKVAAAPGEAPEKFKLTDWIGQHKAKSFGIGVLGGLAMISGIITAVFALIGEAAQEWGDAKEQICKVSPNLSICKKPEVNPEEVKKEFCKIYPDADICKTSDNPLPKPDPDDPEYNKTLEEVAALFSNFDQDMKEMLEKNADYASNAIKFEAGKVDIDGTQVAVSIKYDTEQLDVGLALIPVVITLAPQDLRGFALTPDDILGKMEEGAAKNMLTLVLNPTASFIFTIKLIQLYNATTKDSTKTATAKIEYMLDEATELFSRFILSRDEEIAPDALLSYIQQYPAIVEVLQNKNIKVYKDLADEIGKDTPLVEQKTAFMDMQKSEIVEGPLVDGIKIFYNQFFQVYFKKFKNDGEYVASDFIPGVRATKNNLQAIFYRGLKDVMKAGQELTEAEGKVTLRKLDGTEYEVNPKADLNSFIAKPSAGIEAAANTLKGAIIGLRKIIDAAKEAKKAVTAKDMAGAKAAYGKAIEGIKTASSAASKAILEFRKKLAPYYPLPWDDGTSLTPAEFLIANVKELNDADATNVKTLLNKVYNPFSKHLGLTTSQLLGSTQGKLVDKAFGYAVDVTKSLITKPAPPVTPDTPDTAKAY